MLYAIIATDVANSLEARLAARPAHLERLQVLKGEGRIVLAGPHPAIDSNDPGAAGFTGSLIVAEFDSLSAAQAWADADPYIAAGVYANVIVKPFKLPRHSFNRCLISALPLALNLPASHCSQSLIILVCLPTTCPISIC